MHTVILNCAFNTKIKIQIVKPFLDCNFYKDVVILTMSRRSLISIIKNACHSCLIYTNNVFP